MDYVGLLNGDGNLALSDDGRLRLWDDMESALDELGAVPDGHILVPVDLFVRDFDPDDVEVVSVELQESFCTAAIDAAMEPFIDRLMNELVDRFCLSDERRDNLEGRLYWCFRF